MFKVLSATDDRAEWDDYFKRLPPELQDVHFTSAYARVQLSYYKGHALLVVFVRDNNFVAQPFLLTPVSGDNFELTSLYGYGGPIGTDDGLAARFQDALWTWARQQYVVAEFCCMHPFYNELQKKLLDKITLPFAAAKEVVVIDLEGFGLEQMRRRIRRGVKNAQELGARLDDYGTPQGFSVLYDMSMKRLTAGEVWQYPYEYWDAHQREGVGAFFELSTPTPSGLLQRSLLVIGQGDNAYAHFLGSDGESRHEGLDEFLYYETARNLRDRGFKRFHLGGGLTAETGDSLFAFKSGFSDTRFIANRYGRIFDSAAYDSLCNRRAMHEKEQHGRESKAQFFPLYRRPFQ